MYARGVVVLDTGDRGPVSGRGGGRLRRVTGAGERPGERAGPPSGRGWRPGRVASKEKACLRRRGNRRDGPSGRRMPGDAQQVQGVSPSMRYSILLLLCMTMFVSVLCVCTRNKLTSRAVCGNTTVLACPFTGEGEEMEVTWQKRKRPVDLVVYRSARAGSIQSGGRMTMQPGWSKRRAADLIIHDIRVEDEGTYVCYIRLNSMFKSEICSEVVLEVDRGEGNVWASSTQVTVGLGEDLVLCYAHNPKCFSSNLKVTWMHNSSLFASVIVDHRGVMEQTPNVNASYADGNATLLLQDVSAAQQGNYTCCFRDDTSNPECCVVSNVIITETWSDMEPNLGRRNQHAVTVLLVVLLSCVIIL
ncbi:uncharacterized protein LOC127586520 [Pristis pectinata]|uniref:uncharacterized protein LOC127586520 n=1 Tax=Pristis pectinata TaxID=685728 RepID=UPI00223D8837|nr:uncharacterized protein LOC127586520 [Pristis pectinata]